MERLCERPGCSADGTVSYGMVTDDLVFWIVDGIDEESRTLCSRHADAMVVPRGWTLDDRRQPEPQLFAAARYQSDRAEPPRRARPTRRPGGEGEQLVIDGTGEIDRPRPHRSDGPEVSGAGDPDDPDDPDDVAWPPTWVPAFDDRGDLGGMLDATSPLLARAFRGQRRS